MGNTLLNDASPHVVNLLEEDREQATQYGVSLTPALYINGFEYQGEWQGQDIFRQICSTYARAEIPLVCDPMHDI